MLLAQEVNSHPSIMSQGLSSVPIMPVVLLVNGFQLSSSFYTSYVLRLCSWGYAVLQYDLPGHVLMKKLIPDDQEAALLPQLLRWVSSAQSSHSNKPSVDVMSNNLYHLPKIDLSSIVLAGHSRGGKLAALMLAQANQMGINVKAAALIDPVDMNFFTRILGYPSAVDALRGKGAKALLIGAGVTGSCNPPKEGYHKFWEVLSPLSWQGVIQKAGHMQVTDASGALGWVLDQMCHVGEGMSHENAMELVNAQLVAWLELQLRPGPDTEAGIQAFQSWVESKVKEGALTFKIK
ncbi:hypothetical protein CEUSTIGMA_g9501.t1 [Chlamydomonas eustigma]|uniref:Chlorophyllase n=1 Tax=Chlamydomonas eustigma TaxID=1157962 RepID=A0A250XG96_9CHLO|nr:hypothetical protein CEUSTIGMA_g9501.t1 [Chlamydomonas eustigma]|eukprot:GAX82073.1 hypothetical protein CEUSTIGMA_g9501.t1 [Chlamydomonas eustigma]